MTFKKSPPTKTTLNKIKKESKKLFDKFGSLQERQNIVAQQHGYESYRDFHEAYKKKSLVVPTNPFEGVGSFTGEIFSGVTNEKQNILEISQVTVDEYEITHRFQLIHDQFSEKGINVFCEELDLHIQDYLAHLLKVPNDESRVNPYETCSNLPTDFNLRSIDIAVGIDFPKNIQGKEEFKFAENWFYDEGKGGRITLSNFPNDGEVSNKAISILFQKIRYYAEKAFNTKCYIFPSSNHLDIEWQQDEHNTKSPLTP